MTRTITRALAILSVGVLVLAACGPGGAATTGPGGTSAAVVTPAPTTQGPAGTDGLLSFVMPSFNSDEDLEALLPDELGGVSVDKFSMLGNDFLGDGNSAAAAFDAVLTGFSKSRADLSVAIGGTPDISVTAYRIKGVPAGQFFDAFRSSFGEAQGATITDASFGGKSVKKFVPADGADSEVVYLYGAGDVLFSVGAEDVTDELLNEAFSKLP